MPPGAAFGVTQLYVDQPFRVTGSESGYRNSVHRFDDLRQDTRFQTSSTKMFFEILTFDADAAIRA